MPCIDPYKEQYEPVLTVRTAVTEENLDGPKVEAGTSRETSIPTSSGGGVFTSGIAKALKGTLDAIIKDRYEKMPPTPILCNVEV